MINYFIMSFIYLSLQVNMFCNAPFNLIHKIKGNVTQR